MNALAAVSCMWPIARNGTPRATATAQNARTVTANGRSLTIAEVAILGAIGPQRAEKTKEFVVLTLQQIAGQIEV